MSSDAFDELMASSDPAMIVLTAAVDGDKAGCLVGFHAQASIQPPRYCVWLSKANRTYEIAARADHVGVHFLTSSDLALAKLFGGETGDEFDKFEETPWTYSSTGAPMLTALPHRFEGRRIAFLDTGGDHALLVIEPVVAGGGSSFEPLRLAQVDQVQPGHDADEARD